MISTRLTRGLLAATEPCANLLEYYDLQPILHLYMYNCIICCLLINSENIFLIVNKNKNNTLNIKKRSSILHCTPSLDEKFYRSPKIYNTISYSLFQKLKKLWV